MGSPQAIENVRTEIEVMRKVNHPNCITLETVYESANHIYIVMELVRPPPRSPPPSRHSTRARTARGVADVVLCRCARGACRRSDGGRMGRCGAASCSIASSTKSTTPSWRRRAASRRSCLPSNISTGLSCAPPGSLRLLARSAHACLLCGRGECAGLKRLGQRQQRHRAQGHQARKHPLHGNEQGLGSEAG